MYTNFRFMLFNW